MVLEHFKHVVLTSVAKPTAEMNSKVMGLWSDKYKKD
jgi:hypothetical protein